VGRVISAKAELNLLMAGPKGRIHGCILLSRGFLSFTLQIELPAVIYDPGMYVRENVMVSIPCFHVPLLFNTM